MKPRPNSIAIRLLVGVLALACHLGAALAATPDLARERRWADEIVPQLFVGEAEWLATSHPAIDAWVPVGLTVDFAAPPSVPVEDVVAERDFPEALAFAKTRAARLPKDLCSSSVVVAGTDHYFVNAAHDLARRIAPFLERALAGRC